MTPKVCVAKYYCRCGGGLSGRTYGDLCEIDKDYFDKLCLSFLHNGNIVEFLSNKKKEADASGSLWNPEEGL